MGVYQAPPSRTAFPLAKLCAQGSRKHSAHRAQPDFAHVLPPTVSNGKGTKQSMAVRQTPEWSLDLCPGCVINSAAPLQHTFCGAPGWNKSRLFQVSSLRERPSFQCCVKQRSLLAIQMHNQSSMYLNTFDKRRCGVRPTTGPLKQHELFVVRRKRKALILRMQARAQHSEPFEFCHHLNEAARGPANKG